MKKIISSALLLSVLSLNILPAISAIESVSTDKQASTTISTAEPVQFKSMVKKDKKTSDEYKFDYINVEFWESFNDEYLNDYISRAILNNHELKTATLNVAQYKENVKMQFASELPSAGVGGFGAFGKMPGSTSTQTDLIAPAFVNYELDIFLKNHDKTKAVKKLYENSKLQEKATYISIASAVGSSYLNIVMLDDTINLQENIVAQRREIYDLALLRNEEGLTSTADTIRANKALVAGEVDLIDLKIKHSAALNQLAVLIGESPEKSYLLERSSINEIIFNEAIPEYISSEIIIERPDYMIAEAMVEKAGIDVRVAKKELLPTFNIGGIALFLSSGLSGLFDAKSSLLALGGGAILPLFTGGRLQANIRSKKVAYDKVLVNYLNTNLVAIQEVNDALVNARLNKEKLDKTLQQAQLEQVELGYVKDRFDVGVVSKLDVLENEENVLSIEKLVAMQKTQCMMDMIELYKATGSQPFATIEQ